MNKNNKIYLVLLAVLVILFLVTKLNDKTEKVINFFKIDSLAISRFSLKDANNRILIENQKGAWQIIEPINYPADNIRVNDLIDKLLSARTSNLPLSESEQSLPNYQLQDSLAVLLTFYGKNDKVLDAAYFGQIPGQMQTPARRTDNFKVYLLDQSLYNNLKAETSNWREKIVAEVDKDSIEKIAVLYNEMGYELSRSDTAWVFEDGSVSLDIAADNPSLRTLFSALSKITTTQFKDHEYENYQKLLQKPDMEIVVSQLDGNSLYLRLAKEEEDKNYILQKDNLTDHLFVQYESWLNRFRKTAADFKK